LTARWNEARTTILVDQGNGVTLCLTGGPEFDALRETAADFVPPALPAPDLPALRAAARLQVVAAIEAREAHLTGAVPQNERASWSAKEAAARKWLADQLQLVPALIAAEAAVVGETPLLVAQRIVARADAWLPVTGAHTGHRRVAEAAIAAAETPAAITAALDALRAALTQPA
jgi:hypothetical protein